MAQNSIAPKFVVIGGGTGSFTLLNGLKHYVPNITALVNMADDGGSTGLLRDELGVLPPGDIRQCLVALSESSQRWRDLFNYRFPEGTFAGHSFGNLFLSAVEKMTANFDDAISLAGEVLHISGAVVPVTHTNCKLIMNNNGEEVVGESLITSAHIKPGAKPKFHLTPQARLNPRARKAIEEADLIVIAPGNLYGSLVPALLVKGMKEALQKTNAKVAYVCNLVNKSHQTANFAVHEYIEELERFIGQGVVDYVLYNIDRPSRAALKAYAFEGELPVSIDEHKLAKISCEAVGGNFLSHKKIRRDKNDKLIIRSLIRHDADAVARALLRIYFS